jgi:hypothetical protein
MCFQCRMLEYVYIGCAVAVLHSLHISSTILERCCEGDDGERGNVSRVRKSGSEGEKVQYETQIVSETTLF